MKTITICIAALMLLVANNISAQEEWEPHFFTTGYLVTQFEYADIEKFNERDRYALGLSEAAFSASYLPLEKLEVKGTFLYRTGVESINTAIVEAYGSWTFSEKFKVGLGRYLTPLSPTNNYFYAPLNNSATLPVLINHHVLFPQSFDGIKISGETGSNIKLGYTGIIGQYLSLGHTATDLLGFQGREEFLDFDGTLDIEPSFPLGMALRLDLNVNDVFKIGGNYFFGNGETVGFKDGAPTNFETKRNTFGADVQLSLGDFNFKGEYWYGEMHTNKGEPDDIPSYDDGLYTEASYNLGVFTPFAKYEYLNDATEFPFTKVTVGTSYRPIYQTLFKLEYGKYDFNPSESIKSRLMDTDGNQENANLVILSAVISF